MKKIIVLIAFIFIFFSACSNEDSKISEIKERGELRVGIKTDVPYFGLLNPDTKEPEGLEIDIAHEIAQNILGEDIYVTFIPTTAITRENLLKNNEIDFVIATFTITEERQKSMNFSRPYFIDEIGLLVRNNSNINSVADIDGKKIGATFSSTAYNKLEQKPNDLKIDYELVGAASYPEIALKLENNEIDAIATDKSILYGYSTNDNMILDEGFFPQEYGIATKLENDGFAKLIDKHLKTMEGNGKLEEIINRWLSSN